jgi:hypothetical protein
LINCFIDLSDGGFGSKSAVRGVQFLTGQPLRADIFNYTVGVVDWETFQDRFCINLEICIFSASAGPMQLSTKDDSFTMLGASLMVRIVNPAVHHSDRPRAG